MANMIPWKKTLGARLGAMAIVLVAITVAFVLAGLYVLRIARRDSLAVSYSAGNRVRYMRGLYLANRLVDAKDPAEKARFRAAIDDLVRELEERIKLLRDGDTARDIPATVHPRLIENNRIREEAWRKEIRPLLTERFTPATTREEAADDLRRLEDAVDAQIDRIEA